MSFIQPDWGHVQRAFFEGAKEARLNPDATEDDFWRASDGYTKRVFAEVDPDTNRRIQEDDWS